MTREIPHRVYDLLTDGFVRHQAHELLQGLRTQGGYLPGDVVHPGDSFGTVLAWLWQTAPDEAISLIGDFIAAARHWDDLTTQQRPPIRLNDLLETLPLALPSELNDSEADALIARAKAEIPAQFNTDPNT